MKNIRIFYLKIFIFVVKFSLYLNRRVFVMQVHLFKCLGQYGKEMSKYLG